ncbi:tripartite tricarboxylate transporter substrate binding protein [Roseomonas eburnea]|uniref:Tripartite tricarboxylate transporter substrate binding protein n=1 Tax=Neoroseomonas eburnea TaxID=1346889 RepID=A0A9X9X951_9PROT|nr:tripartite tricarboxylate transporter substrate binding protein [Neoroseomonas eburnea]MBR0680237.1 tripartite tricarboxylate transporter substrate binding protein [Neoroseomonas eburnea]
MIARRHLALAALPLLARPALAQGGAWPNRTIRLIIPWPPGQATDLVGRIMAQRLSDKLGQQVVPENKPGAGGSIGTDFVAKAAPDGHTLLAASIGPISFGPLIHRLPYDVERDLAPIATFSGSPYVLVVRTDSPARDARGLLAMLRAAPGRHTYASSGVGGAQHLLGALFVARTQVEVLHVPFQGSGPAMAALLGGQVDFAIETLAGAGALIREGKLRALGVTVGRRTALMPEVPPIAEAADLPGYDYIGWIGLMAPAATPRPILDRLSAELAAASALEETRLRLASIGTEAIPRGPDEFRALLAEQRVAFGAVIRQLGIRAE